jgi:hypothetical protein
MSNTNILINVGAQTAAAVRNLKDVTDQLDNQQKKSGGWGGALKGAGALAAGGFAAAGAAILGVGASMLKFAEDAIADNKVAQGLADTLDKIPGVTQKVIDANSSWIDSMELATSVSDDKLRAAMGKLATATGDVTEAQKLTALAADVSTGRNISLEASTKLLEKAANGNTAALEKQMPWLDKNRDGTITYDEAVKGLTKRFGGAAEAASNRDPYAKMLIIWGQLKEALGQWILPFLDKFSEWFKNKDNQKKIQDFIDKVADLSEQLGKKAVKAIGDFIDWLNSPEGKAAMADFKENMDKIWKAVQSVVKWLDENDAALNTVKGAFKGMSAWVGVVVGYWTTIGNAIESAWNWLIKIKNAIGGGVGKILDFVGIGRMDIAYAPTAALSRTAQSGYTSAPTGYGPTIIVNGAIDPESTARQIRSILTGQDLRQGRAPGQALARAW